jgi:RecG-like helicase
VVGQHALPDGKPRRHQGQRGPSKGATPIGSVTTPRKVTVEGKVRVIEIRPVEHNSVLAVEIHDPTGNLTAMFYGRSNIPGLICGSRVRLQGSAGIRDGQPVMINPAYELVSAVEEE